MDRQTRDAHQTQSIGIDVCAREAVRIASCFNAPVPHPHVPTLSAHSAQQRRALLLQKHLQPLREALVALAEHLQLLVEECLEVAALKTELKR